MPTKRVIVVGAGIGGLVAALELATAGLEVTVVERAEQPGGKLREVAVDGRGVDSGPTVFTMAWVFEAIFARAGTSMGEQLSLKPAALLARHAWGEDERLDLFADPERSADAIACFAGSAEARGYRAFRARAKRVFEALDEPFIRAAEPTPQSLAKAHGLRGLGDLMKIRPFAKLWPVLGEYFQDPRLRQLFARYATYCGSDPFQAVATLMLIAHVEQAGVWRIEGGMGRLVDALTRVGATCGVTFRYAAEVEEIGMARGRANGVRLTTGDWLTADAVIANVDARAVAQGLLGTGARAAVPRATGAQSSLSAVTHSLTASVRGFELAHHNVFFCRDYAAEFGDIFARGRLPREPTVYVCAQDRDDVGRRAASGRERLLCVTNAPPADRAAQLSETDIARYGERCFGVLRRAGLVLERRPDHHVVTTPHDFARMFPGSGGALYGQAAHGWRSSFARPGARTRIPGMYLAGGSVHPGAGVPMAAISGRHAAACVLADAP